MRVAYVPLTADYPLKANFCASSSGRIIREMDAQYLFNATDTGKFEHRFVFLKMLLIVESLLIWSSLKSLPAIKVVTNRLVKIPKSQPAPRKCV